MSTEAKIKPGQRVEGVEWRCNDCKAPQGATVWHHYGNHRIWTEDINAAVKDARFNPKHRKVFLVDVPGKGLLCWRCARAAGHDRNRPKG